jgi:A/G-specific adenine glycosylase
MIDLEQAVLIRKAIRAWYEKNARDLPWRHTKNPYVIWLSEIILQQTRVEQGMPYFLKFVEHYPDIFALASAPIDDIKKLWEGLGYYRRAENMHKTAKIIVEKHKGVFPATYGELIQLPGIGPYTAAAIASFAFDEPVALADGNVNRVLARLFDIETPVNSSKGGKLMLEIANKLLDKENPAAHNQSMMEFGALQCVPKNPGCGICPVQDYCKAFALDKTAQLPVKTSKKPSRKRYFHYLISITTQGISASKRNVNDIWRGLYEFPVVEFQTKPSVKEIVRTFEEKFQVDAVELKHLSSQTHKLSHQDLHLDFWMTRKPIPRVQYIDLETVQTKAFPVVLRRILDDIINITNFEP